jgi:hypothetical protein
MKSSSRMSTTRFLVRLPSHHDTTRGDLAPPRLRPFDDAIRPPSHDRGSGARSTTPGQAKPRNLSGGCGANFA